MVQKRTTLGIFSTFWIFPEQQGFFCGKCDMMFSREQRARHFKLLFVAFYSQIVSTYGAEEYDMLQMEPIS